MTKVFLLATFFSIFLLNSQSSLPGGYGPYEEVYCSPEQININPGDVISADVLNEILTRINNLQTGGIESEQDLVGEWSCTSTCRFGACREEGGIWNGYWKNEDGIYVVSQTISISSESPDKIRLRYPYNLGQSFQETGEQDCFARVKNGKIFVTNSSTDTSDYENTCWNTGTFDIEMVSNQCFRMENINDSVTSCKKINIPPSSPLSLKVSLSGSSASLSWQKGDDRQTGFSVKRKQSIEGEFEEIVTTNSDSFLDNSISSGNTYWYRVFATNEYGEGTGSNVVTITSSE